MAVISKLNDALPFGVLSGALTVATTLQRPRGIAFGTATASDNPSAPTEGDPIGKLVPLQLAKTVLVGPSGSENVSCNDVGEAARLAPSAGFEPTRELSAEAVGATPARTTAKRKPPTARRAQLSSPPRTRPRARRA